MVKIHKCNANGIDIKFVKVRFNKDNIKLGGYDIFNDNRMVN